LKIKLSETKGQNRDKTGIILIKHNQTL